MLLPLSLLIAKPLHLHSHLRRLFPLHSLIITILLPTQPSLPNHTVHIHPRIRRNPLPTLPFLVAPPELLAKIRNRLLRDQLLKRPLVDVGRGVVVEFLNVLDGSGEDGAFVLFAAGDDLGEFVDAFVDGFAAASLDWFGRFASVLLKTSLD